MADVSGLATATTGALALSNLILVTPKKNKYGLPQTTNGYQPQLDPTYKNNPGTPPSAILFHYEGEQTVSLNSDITDHYIENNSAIQDQISLKPEIITTHGFVGELNNVPPESLTGLKVVAEKLTAIGAYTPGLSATAALAYAEASFVYRTATVTQAAAVQAWSSINGTGGETVINGSSQVNASGELTNKVNIQNQQQIYFQQFYGYWKNRQLFTVQTPWAVFQDCAIQSLRAIQEEGSTVITDFEVTFKIMRFASTELRVTTFDSNTAQGQLADQGASTVDNGPQTPQQSVLPFDTAIKGAAR